MNENNPFMLCQFLWDIFIQETSLLMKLDFLQSKAKKDEDSKINRPHYNSVKVHMTQCEIIVVCTTHHGMANDVDQKWLVQLV